MKRRSPSGIARVRSGFTLLELLVVMAVIAIIAAATISAFQNQTAALNLSTASQLIASEITTARQTALTYRETVEVRFYLYTDSITGTQQYQAIQTFSTRDNANFSAMDKITYLPVNIMIDHSTGSTYTTARSYPFNETSTTANPMYTPNGTVNGIATTGAQRIPGSIGLNYTYKYLRFKFGGSIDYLMPASLPTGWPPATWYITLYEKKYASAAAANIKNFITVSIDSLDGRVRTFQP